MATTIITEDSELVSLLLRLSTDPAEAMAFADDAMDRLRTAEAADYDDESPLAPPVATVRCGQCGFRYHPDCLVCVMGGAVA